MNDFWRSNFWFHGNSNPNDYNIAKFSYTLLGGRRKLHEPMTDMKIKAGIKQNTVRGPLKAMPQTAMKPTRERDPPISATKSVFKRLQPSNTSSSSNTSMVEVCVEQLLFQKLFK